MEKGMIGVHEVRLDNIEKNVSEIKEKLDPIFEFVIAQRTKDEIRASKNQYIDSIRSGSIAAVIGAVAAWLTTRF